MRANQTQGDMFTSLGGSENPDGIISSVYKTANLALAKAMDMTRKTDREAALLDIKAGLRHSVIGNVGPIFRQGQRFGKSYADQQLDIYKLDKPGNQTKPMNEQRLENYSASLNVIRKKLDDQFAQLEALDLLGEKELILGNDMRKGVLKESSIITAAVYYISALIWDSFESEIGHARALTGMDYLKQAIAVLDRRTTECCLRVHGQVQPFNTDFQLRGSPAFDSHLDWPPFHGRCRTSIVLYNSLFDLGITEAMQTDAAWLLSMHALGIFPDQWPADAFFPHNE